VLSSLKRPQSARELQPCLSACLSPSSRISWSLKPCRSSDSVSLYRPKPGS
jgi:hypothetical protein